MTETEWNNIGILIPLKGNRKSFKEITDSQDTIKAFTYSYFKEDYPFKNN